MFIDPGHCMKPLGGRSLDDLWAEAMGDKEEAFAEENPNQVIFSKKDLDALLVGLGSEELDAPSTNGYDELAG
jgi:pilus assembly protein FimV